MKIEEKALYIYHSNVLDNITLSYDQTMDIIQGKVDIMEGELTAPDGQNFEVAVVQSHLRALNYVIAFPNHKPITETVVLETHKRLMAGIILSHGEYRECSIDVPHPSIKPFPYKKIPKAMKQLVQFIEKAYQVGVTNQDHLAWRIHHEFCLFHPFLRGNGRCARLFYNLVRIKFGLAANIISSEDPNYYFKTIVDYQDFKEQQLQQLKQKK